MILNIEIFGVLRKVELEKQGDNGYLIAIDGKQLAVEASFPRPGVLSLLIENKVYRCVLDEDSTDPAIYVGHERLPFRVDDQRSLTARRSKGGLTAGPISIKAPMPGRVVRLSRAEGEEVENQQGVIVIEAMKMQNELKAPKAGRVIRILVAVGDAVISGQQLAIIE
jgi:biotin carboxyl carrier protein